MKHIHKILLVLLALLIIICCGCIIANSDKKIIVTYENWSGWDSEYKSPHIELEYIVSRGDNVTPNVDCKTQEFSFEVIKITNTSVTIKTNQCMSASKVNEKGIDLDSKQTTFKIKRGQKIKLKTLTMDMGDIYVIHYK